MEGEQREISWYASLASQVDEIADAGITDVWLPPPSASVTEQGYLPTHLYDLDSAYGTKDELKRLVEKLHQKDIRAIADIVINHRCGEPDSPVDGVPPSWESVATLERSLLVESSYPLILAHPAAPPVYSVLTTV